MANVLLRSPYYISQDIVQKETKEQIKKMLKDAYKKDILEQLNTLKAIK